MKVLYIIGGKGKRYGSEVVAMQLIDGLRKKLNYVVITWENGVINKLCEELGIENHVIPLKPYVYKETQHVLTSFIKRFLLLCRAEAYSAVGYIKLSKKVDLDSIDLIHTNLSRDMLGGIVSKKKKIPHVWHIQELFDAHYGLQLLKFRQIDWMNKHSKLFIPISETVSNDWIKHGIAKKKMHVVLNGIEGNDSVADRKKCYKKRRIIMVGELSAAKGQRFVVEAISKLRDEYLSKIELDFYGEGQKEYIEFLRSLIKTKKLEKFVHLCGYNNNVLSVLKDYDISVNASRGEGFGLTTAEAMMAGVCPLVADTGANPELVKDKITGVIYKGNDGEDFRRCLEYLLDNPDKTEEMSNRAKEDAAERFMVTRMQEQVYEVYLKAISN